ncbi:hypothetical protein [Luteimonas qiangzhengi]|uniref:hypothetical protein n=1 Tax=Luteimonas sp. MJ146 TaxID=3129240 RepID=UPI0031BAFF45
MIQIREAHGRYEVLSPDRHWEMCDDRIHAQAAALALAAEIESETGEPPAIIAPWPIKTSPGAAGPQ